MPRIALLVACLAWSGCGRRVQVNERLQTSEVADGQKVLPSLLLPLDPSIAFVNNQAASNPTILNRQSVVSHRMAHLSMVEPIPSGPGGGVLNVEDGPIVKADETYRMMISTVLKSNASLSSQASQFYDMFDMNFMELLTQEIKTATPENKTVLEDFQNEITTEMARRMEQAAASLQDLLRSPSLVVMEGKMAALARKGKVDTALIDLLEGNMQQAKNAGEAGKKAVAVMTKLKDIVRQELDRKVKPEIALVRSLLRMDKPKDRKELLREKLSPKIASNVLVAGMTKEQEEQMQSSAPDVSPKDLVRELEILKGKFGNLDQEYDSGFCKRVDEIIEEAEEVTRDIAGGREISTEEAQDMAWEEDRVSVWDLAALEEHAHEKGGMAAWEEEAQQQMNRQETDAREQAAEADWGLS